MPYTATQVEGQNLQYKIEWISEDSQTQMTFNVACANNESEIPDLVQAYLDVMQGNVVYTITTSHVISERERRLAEGFDYNFNDGRGIHRIGTTSQDMIGWDEVTKFSSAAIALGQANTVLNIVTNTGPVTLTAMEWQQILVAAAQFRQPIWAASFYLQSLNPIPADYANNVYWTA